MPVTLRRCRFYECEERICPSGAVAAVGESVIAFSTVLTNESGEELATDSAGRYIVSPDATLGVSVFADDLRDVGTAGGVFSGFVTAATDTSSDALTFDGPISYGPGFDLGQAGTVEPSELLKVGALQSSLTPVGSDPRQLLFATIARTGSDLDDGNILSIELESGEDPPTTLNLAFGLTGQANSSYEGAEIIIEAHPWYNSNDAQDVNDDGRVSVSDVIIVVNHILRSGAPDQLGLRTVTQEPRFYDVVPDGQCNLDDVYGIVDRIILDRAAQVAPTADS